MGHLEGIYGELKCACDVMFIDGDFLERDSLIMDGGQLGEQGDLSDEISVLANLLLLLSRFQF